MKELIEAYIDSFNEITILVDKTIYNTNKRFFIKIDSDLKELDITNVSIDETFYKYIVRFLPEISLNKDYYIYDEKNHKAYLRSGSIIRTYEFENRFRYKGPLGVEYHYEASFFRIWSPVAKEINLELIINNEKKIIPLEYKEYGLWEVEVSGDLEYAKYIYHVRVFDYFVRINDPYAISSTADEKYNYVIDLFNLYKMKYKKPNFSGKYTDAVIYEASIRDFTATVENEYKGSFMGMVDNRISKHKEAYGLDYIKSLGITHLQVLPIFDFGGVDAVKKDELYNWGYNPEQFFIPAAWYSINPDDPYSRINELLEFVDEAHKRGIRVIMDVVFNHVYRVKDFAFENLVPGYFFRIEDDGNYCNSSGCGNVLASEKFMASRFINDVLCYYAKVFHISGFRFDLMGLLDIGTLNHARESLYEIDDKIMLYGEGWNMASSLPEELRPHMYNYKMIPSYGFFNDKFRDYIKGNNWGVNPGYAFGGEKSHKDICNLILGSCVNQYKFDEPYRSINYVECHDNYTFYDFGKYKLQKKDKEIYLAAKFALEFIMLSEGVPFIHAGEEFLRTKYGVENSYNSNDEINKIDYARRDKYISLVDTVRDLISLRKEYSVFRLTSEKEILSKTHNSEGLKHKNLSLIFLNDDKYTILLVIKNDLKKNLVEFENYKMIFDTNRKCNITKKQYMLDNKGIYVFKKEGK